MSEIERWPDDELRRRADRIIGLEVELQEATMHEAACGRELSDAHRQLQGAVDALMQIQARIHRDGLAVNAGELGLIAADALDAATGGQ